MKKFCFVFSLLFFCLGIFGLVGCKEKTDDLSRYVSELRCELYEGSNEKYSLKASYGYREQNYSNDGKVGNKVYTLSFRLDVKETQETTYLITLVHDGKTYDGEFKLHPAKHSLTCAFEIKNFAEKSFTVKVGISGEQEEITLTSIIPDGTLTYAQALEYLYKNQKSLVDSYYNADGVFTAEIYERVLVKDGKAYWYIGLASGNGKLKALLIDGKTGDVLATREIL